MNKNEWLKSRCPGDVNAPDFRTETWRSADIEEVKNLIRAAQYQIDTSSSEGAIASLAAAMKVLQK